jgi:ankyrin repeat protein
MKKTAVVICLFGLAGNLSGCSANDANTYVRENFSDPQVRALVMAADDGDIKTVDRLIAAGVNVNARGNDGITPLIWTIYHHKMKGYQALLEHGADPNLQIQSGRHKGDSAMETAAQEQDSSYLKLALEHGGNPNLVDSTSSYDYTPLFSAILGGRKENVELLIRNGANINLKIDNYNDQTPLGFAVGEDEYEIAYMLLQAGANYKLVDQIGPNKGHNSFVWDLEHPGNLDPSSDAYKWRAKAIEFMNAHGVKVKSELPKPMCSEDLGNGVNVLGPCDQLNNKEPPK